MKRQDKWLYAHARNRVWTGLMTLRTVTENISGGHAPTHKPTCEQTFYDPHDYQCTHSMLSPLQLEDQRVVPEGGFDNASPFRCCRTPHCFFCLHISSIYPYVLPSYRFTALGAGLSCRSSGIASRSIDEFTSPIPSTFDPLHIDNSFLSSNRQPRASLGKISAASQRLCNRAP